jgi:hypothetical protein
MHSEDESDSRVVDPSTVGAININHSITSHHLSITFHHLSIIFPSPFITLHHLSSPSITFHHHPTHFTTFHHLSITFPSPFIQSTCITYHLLSSPFITYNLHHLCITFASPFITFLSHFTIFHRLSPPFITFA